MWKTVKHLLLKLHERKLGSVTHVKVTHLNFFTPIHLSDSFCVASLMFYIETSFFSGMQWSLVFFFNSSFNFNEWLLVVPQFLSVCNSFTWIHICNVQFRINTNKENPRVVFLIYELGISIYTAGKCSILQVTCFPLG